MKKIFSRTLYVAVCVSIALACKPKFEEQPAATAGSANFSTFVALGNSITAGYADGALYRKGQEASYAKILADQLKLAGAGEFKIPYVNASSPGVGQPYVGPSGLVYPGPFSLSYVTDCKGVTSLSPKAVAGDPTIFTTSVASEGLFNSIGVPGAKSFHVVYKQYGNPANGVGNFNPFFTRTVARPDTTSMLEAAMMKNPTFFSLFIGNNDVLLYALAGGTGGTTITPSAGAVGAGFDATMDAIANTLVSGGAKGVIANVPDITSLPHFTTVPYNGLVLNEAQVTALNNAYNGTGITFQVGANPFIIADASVPVIGLRKILSTEYVLLSTPQDSLKCAGWGSSKPIPNAYILTAAEITAIKDATNAYNDKLKAIAIAKDLAFVDANAFLKSAISGITFNGVKVSTTFVSGGAFSLDGVHLTPLGNALLANEFIKAINAKYGSTIPQVDPTKYKGVTFPN